MPLSRQPGGQRIEGGENPPWKRSKEARRETVFRAGHRGTFLDRGGIAIGRIFVTPAARGGVRDVRITVLRNLKQRAERVEAMEERLVKFHQVRDDLQRSPHATSGQQIEQPPNRRLAANHVGDAQHQRNAALCAD